MFAEADGNDVGGDLPSDENVISHSAEDAIQIAGVGSDDNLIARNTGRENGDRFIDLVAGANLGVTAPTITSATTATAAGTSDPNAGIRIFESTVNDPGRIDGFVAFTVADSMGNWSAPVTGFVSQGQFVAATQSTGALLANTSELSSYVLVGP
jgi:hypothetical protein